MPGNCSASPTGMVFIVFIANTTAPWMTDSSWCPHPMSLQYHKEEMPWAHILHRAAEMGYTSHQSGTCGLHVHVSRAAFGDTEAAQDAAIARVLYFFEKNWEELLKFSRRTQRQLDHWAARYGYREQPRDILEHAKKGSHAGRYTCVNLENRATIEFRIFRGTPEIQYLPCHIAAG